MKIYYNEKGWVLDRYPYGEFHSKKSPFIEVDEVTYERTLSTDEGCRWRVTDGKLAEEVYDQSIIDEIARINELLSLKEYLSDTDYVVSKLNEAKLESEDEFETLKAKYADVLERRKTARSRINELEKEEHDVTIKTL